MTKSTKWFIGILGVLTLFVAGGIVLILVLFPFSRVGRTDVVTIGSGEKLAVVELVGEIRSSDDVIRQLKKYRKDNSIHGIVLRIDSPGGAVVPSQEMYEEVKKTRERKPVVVSMGSLAASGGYYVSCGASKIVANMGTLTGSIGVISEFLQLRDALTKLGIDVKTIKSGKLKDAGSSTRKMTGEDQRYFQELMDNVHKQFITVVQTERKLSRRKVMAIADGRVFTGEQAVRLGLVDTLGTFEDAVRLAANLAGIEGEPAIVRERKKTSFWDPFFQDAAEKVRAIKEEILDKPVLSYRFVEPF